MGLQLNVEMLRREPQSAALWVEAETIMQRCMTEVRTISYLLHPPTMDVAGFASAARWYVERLSQRGTVKISLETPENLGRLPDAIELALYRVLQEALTNVHRHSGASTAHVSISIEDPGQGVILQIRDNGRGIPNDELTHFRSGFALGVGLAGIRERTWELGGKLKIESDSNGTLVSVTVPLSHE